MDLLRIATSAGIILGGLAVIGGVGHWIAVTGVAVRARRGYDVRLATLLAIGFLPVLCGLGMVTGAWQALQGISWGAGLLAASAGLFSLIFAVLWPVMSRPPEGNAPGAAAVLVVYVAEAVLAAGLA